MMVLCSLCGKSNREVEHVLAGRRGNICSECVDLCAEVLADIRRHRAPAPHPEHEARA